ncbi:MAG: Fic family protein [Thioalkalivibrio sp.]
MPRAGRSLPRSARDGPCIPPHRGRDGKPWIGWDVTHLGLRHRAHFRHHYLAPALQRGLEMTLPETPNSRLQQYRLTAKGQKYLKD